VLAKENRYERRDVATCYVRSTSDVEKLKHPRCLAFGGYLFKESQCALLKDVPVSSLLHCRCLPMLKAR